MTVLLQTQAGTRDDLKAPAFVDAALPTPPYGGVRVLRSVADAMKTMRHTLERD